MLTFTNVQDLSSDNSSSTSSSSSLVLSEMEVLLGTSYMGEVYFPTPLTVLHPGEEEEGWTASYYGFPLPVGAPR